MDYLGLTYLSTSSWRLLPWNLNLSPCFIYRHTGMQGIMLIRTNDWLLALSWKIPVKCVWRRGNFSVPNYSLSLTQNHETFIAQVIPDDAVTFNILSLLLLYDSLWCKAKYSKHTISWPFRRKLYCLQRECQFFHLVISIFVEFFPVSIVENILLWRKGVKEARIHEQPFLCVTCYCNTHRRKLLLWYCFKGVKCDVQLFFLTFRRFWYQKAHIFLIILDNYFGFLKKLKHLF